ncbi:hypothetical protein E2C01_003833 [Portunus trituberculatus]|uniref:Uncharacterized protein n=1 Tax=Portunus trituberculatus TaxID=210409 RepID=A0A5B7CPQ0_PORTR|nr:hypothetical protein [Portunus trituberculatus]
MLYSTHTFSYDNEATAVQEPGDSQETQSSHHNLEEGQGKDTRQEEALLRKGRTRDTEGLADPPHLYRVSRDDSWLSRVLHTAEFRSLARSLMALT